MTSLALRCGFLSACLLAAMVRADESALPDLPVVKDTELRIAYSADGIAFERDALFAPSAGWADLELLRNGDLLAVFDVVDGDELYLASTRSKDGGKTWTQAQRLHLIGSPPMSNTARHADLVVLPDGRLRLFFSFAPNWTKNRREQMRRPSLMRAVGWADGVDGVHFKTAGTYATQLKGLADLHPTAVLVEDEFRVFAQSLLTDERGRDRAARRIEESVSKDGHAYELLPIIQVPRTIVLGSIIPEGKGLRAYATAVDGAISLTSRDGRVWEESSAITPKGALFPAVARLADGTRVMIYTAAARDQQQGGGAPLVPAPAPPPVRVDENGDGAAPAEQAGPSSAEDPAAAVSGDMGGESVELEADAPIPSASDGSGFRPDRIPAPNFAAPVDYLQWLRTQTSERLVDNAYDIYAQFLPGPDNLTATEDWPKLVGLFQDDSYQGPIGPWRPDDHPDWETSHHAAAPLMQRLRDATRIRDYAIDPRTAGGDEAGGANRLLISILLPHLSPHRQLIRQLMSDAWRSEDGRVAPDTMRGAWETALRASDHMDQGSTLIERLVGHAERELVRDNARRALAQGVFQDDVALETALASLEAGDRPARGLTDTLHGEYASVMDLTQYIFSPASADGQPQYNAARAEEVAEVGLGREHLEAMSRMTPQQVRATGEQFARAYDELDGMLATGYPQVRRADIDAWHERYRGASPMTETLLPGLSRVAQIRARAEASRRATQLAYGAGLFKAREGRWPASLAELRDLVGADVAVDPMSGGAFGYRLDSDGPRIWSAGENAVDDGGDHAPRWGEGEGEASDDYVFYPPQG